MRLIHESVLYTRRYGTVFPWDHTWRYCWSPCPRDGRGSSGRYRSTMGPDLQLLPDPEAPPLMAVECTHTHMHIPMVIALCARKACLRGPRALSTMGNQHSFHFFAEFSEPPKCTAPSVGQGRTGDIREEGFLFGPRRTKQKFCTQAQEIRKCLIRDQRAWPPNRGTR